jgi:hypothetical protein
MDPNMAGLDLLIHSNSSYASLTHLSSHLLAGGESKQSFVKE